MRTVDDERGTVPAGRVWTWRTVLLAFAVAYGTYAAARWLGLGAATAFENTRGLVELERSLGIAVEVPVQRAFDAPAAVWILNHVYMAAQFLVVPAALLLVRRHSIAAFRRLRDVLLLTWVLATPVNAFFPVAPPRMADIGLTDTITASGSSAMNSSLSTAFYNPLAAVPSLHVAFAFTVGVAVLLTVRSPALRVLGALWGPIVTLAVVATGNHFVLDAAAGVALAALSYGLLRLPAPQPRALLAPVGALLATPA
ncbi:phosphatase PAP2 family protein, partial [Patulibacter sp.]|uniref:phosphatase PAP2 family protein n=1 Tax=Patulibacter sp. TaxID=1912859 RepID=UPI002724FA43